jgi:hypothetical protein
MSSYDYPSDSGVEIIDARSANIYFVSLHIDMNEVPTGFPHNEIIHWNNVHTFGVL